VSGLSTAETRQLGRLLRKVLRRIEALERADGYDDGISS
jgi:hypothetical protein